MTESQDFDIVGSFNNQIYSPIDSERSINLFEYRDLKAKKPKILLTSSGLINSNFNFGSATNGFRAEFVFLGEHYMVIGNSLFVESAIGTISLLGNLINTNTGYVAIDGNRFQLMIVDGVNGYIWDTIALTFTLITDQSFPVKPIDLCSLDGFFVVANGDTNTFQLSSFNQGLVWGVAQDFFTADASTNLITISNTANYQTGVTVFLVAPTVADEFTADSTTDLLTLISPAVTTNYITGSPVKLSNSGGALPTPLLVNTEYYCINVSTTTLKLALTYADSIANIPIDLTDNGTGTQRILAQLPDPLTNDQTYYTIRVSATTLRLATSYENAINNIPIILLSNGGLANQMVSDGQLQLGSITTHPGNIVACRTLHRRLFLFSDFFTEVWYNAGAGTNLPFRRDNTALIEHGTASRSSIASSFDKMFFLSLDRDSLGSVMQVIGSEAVPVSTKAIDTVLAYYAKTKSVSDCTTFLVKENGMIFYRMNFTIANHTFIYNVTQSNLESDEGKLWHEEEVLNGDRHPAQTHAYFNGINYVGHYSLPILYQLDNQTYTNDGEAIKRTRITRPFYPPGAQRIRVDRLQIDLVQGNIDLLETTFSEMSLDTEMNVEILTENSIILDLEQELTNYNLQPAFVFLSISKDGGQTYGYSYKSPMGNLGQRTFRTLWRKLGTTKRGQSFVCKFEFYNTIPFIVLGASWCMEVLPQ